MEEGTEENGGWYQTLPPVYNCQKTIALRLGSSDSSDFTVTRHELPSLSQLPLPSQAEVLDQEKNLCPRKHLNPLT